MLPYIENYLIFGFIFLLLSIGVLAALRPFIWWLFGIEYQIKLLERLANQRDYRPPTDQPQPAPNPLTRQRP